MEKYFIITNFVFVLLITITPPLVKSFDSLLVRDKILEVYKDEEIAPQFYKNLRGQDDKRSTSEKVLNAYNEVMDMKFYCIRRSGTNSIWGYWCKNPIVTFFVSYTTVATSLTIMGLPTVILSLCGLALFLPYIFTFIHLFGLLRHFTTLTTKEES